MGRTLASFLLFAALAAVLWLASRNDRGGLRIGSLDDAEGRSSASEPMPSPPAAPGPELVRGFTAVTPPPPRSGGGDAEPVVQGVPPVSGARGVRARVEVVFDRPEGWPYVAGDLHALPVGTRRFYDDDRVPWAGFDSREDDVGILELPDRGPWDIVFTGAWGTAAARDVKVPDSGRARVRLAWPRLQPMRLRLADGARAGLDVKLTVSDAANEDLDGVPGAGEAAPVEYRGTLRAGASLTTPALAVGRRYHLRASFPRTEGRRTPALEIVPTVIVHQDDAPIDLRIVEAAFLHVEPAAPDAAPRHWGTWRPGVRLAVTDAYGRRHVTQLEIEADDGELEIDGDHWRLPPGRVSIVWSGRGIRPGRLDDVTLAARERRILEPTFAWDTEVSPPRPRLRRRVIRVSGLDDACVTLGAMLTTDDGFRTAWNRDVNVVDGTLVLERAYATSTSVLIHRGMAEASWPVRLDVGTPKPLRLRPAGHLVVVPHVHVKPDLGGLRLRRADGGPIMACTINGEKLDSAGAFREVDAEPGAVLGPLPEGEHVFEVRLGPRRLPDAKGVVRAGRMAALHVRW